MPPVFPSWAEIFELAPFLGKKKIGQRSYKILSIGNSKSWKVHPLAFFFSEANFAGSKCHHETSIACAEPNYFFTKKSRKVREEFGYCDCTGIAERISEVHNLTQDLQWKHFFLFCFCDLLYLWSSLGGTGNCRKWN